MKIKDMLMFNGLHESAMGFFIYLTILSGILFIIVNVIAIFIEDEDTVRTRKQELIGEKIQSSLLRGMFGGGISTIIMALLYRLLYG